MSIGPLMADFCQAPFGSPSRQGASGRPSERGDGAGRVGREPLISDHTCVGLPYSKEVPSTQMQWSISATLRATRHRRNWASAFDEKRRKVAAPESYPIR